MRTLFVSVVVLLVSVTTLAQEQQFANLGDFKLDSGEIIRACRIGYRIFGNLNADKSNAIILPTWASGTTEQLKSSVGPGSMLGEKYFVIAVDALGNGVSSSPSNSKAQPRMKFWALMLCRVSY